MALSFRFALDSGRVEITCDESRTASLSALRSRFVSSQTISAQQFSVDLDDLLVNLYELASWPAADTDVDWERSLLDLVETNAIDAEILDARMREPGGTGATPSASELMGSRWNAPLTSFQLRDLGRLAQLRHGANFSVPGAGKTRVGVGLFHLRRERSVAERMLVVAPKSAFESWEFETALCLTDHAPRIARVGAGSLPTADILLVNYERLPDTKSALLKWLRAAPSMMVLDEAHRMKLGPAGAWGAACLSLGPHAATRLVMSGTPAPNGAKDLENIMAFVWPGQGRRRVAAATRNDLRTASHLLRPLFVRTTKKDLGLPPVDRVVRRIQLPTLHRELYDALLGQASARFVTGAEDAEALGRVLLYLLMAATTPALLAVGASRYDPLPYRLPPLEAPTNSSLADLMRDLPSYELSPKYQETLQIVAANAAAGRKTLVWSTFVRNLTSLRHLLGDFKPAMVHGGTVEREDEIRRFREDPDCLVLLSNPATLGEGVSLHQVCHDSVYVDRDFAAGRFIQSLDRIHRLGLEAHQHTRVTVLVSANTIDDLVDQRLAAKVHFMGTVLDDPAVLELSDFEEEPTAAAGMNAEDLAGLVAYLNSASA